jgi:hypothetical protein
MICSRSLRVDELLKSSNHFVLKDNKNLLLLLELTFTLYTLQKPLLLAKSPQSLKHSLLLKKHQFFLAFHSVTEHS